MISGEQAGLIDEIAESNPLLFDFVLKRCLRLREDGREFRLTDGIFETDHLFRNAA